jgi:hypothetical protein
VIDSTSYSAGLATGLVIAGALLFFALLAVVSILAAAFVELDDDDEIAQEEFPVERPSLVVHRGGQR